MGKYVNCVWKVTVIKPLQLKERHYLLVKKTPNTKPNRTTKTLRVRLSQLPEHRPLDSYPLKRRDKY